MILYYSSLDNIIKNNQCCKLYAYLCNGYLIKNISEFNNLRFLRIHHIKLFNKNKTIGLIDYEIINDTILLHNLSIDDQYQKNGLASNLLKRMELDAHLHNMNKIILDIHQNKRNYVFYNKRVYNLNDSINGIKIIICSND
jgi:hypothetical protein